MAVGVLIKNPLSKRLYNIIYQDDDPHQRLLIEAIKDDSLRKIEKERKREAEKTILMSAKLIAPVIETSFGVGFDWCIERVKESIYSELASELEITKALTFLREKDIPRVSAGGEWGYKCEHRDRITERGPHQLALFYAIMNSPLYYVAKSWI